MEPRPILLVQEPLCEADDKLGQGEVKLDGSIDHLLSREGYIVLRCPAAAMGAFRIVAACPFTAADVAVLRAMSETVSVGLFPRDTCATLVSIASRMEAML